MKIGVNFDKRRIIKTLPFKAEDIFLQLKNVTERRIALLKPAEECQETLKWLWKKSGYDTSACYKIICRSCGKTFFRRRPDARYCSYRCTNDSYMLRRKQRKEIEREKRCPICRNQFHAKRKDTLYCSARCKQQAYRNRVVTNISCA
jgi:hypothetical protein